MKRILNILKSPFLNLIVIAGMALVIYFLVSQVGSLKSEVTRLNTNFNIAKTGFEKRIDKLGDEFAVTRSSVLTKEEFKLYENRMNAELNSMGIKTRNLVRASFAGFSSNYSFVPELDTLFNNLIGELDIVKGNEDSSGSGYTIIETYADPDGWFRYEKVNGKVGFWTTDSVFYATIREKPLKPNGERYSFFGRLFKKKVEKLVFRNKNPNSKIEFIEAIEIAD